MLYKDEKFPLIHPKLILNTENISDISDYMDDLYYHRKDIDTLTLIDRFFNTNLIGMNRRFIEGRFYIFDYMYPNTTKNKKEAYDLRPFVYVLEEMFLSDNRYLIRGINLNYLAQNHKVELMELYMNIFNRIIQYDVSNLSDNKLLIYMIDKELLNYYNTILFSLFSNLKDSIRQWDTERIVYRSVDFISPTHYNIIPFYTGMINSIKGEHWEYVSKNIILNRV